MPSTRTTALCAAAALAALCQTASIAHADAVSDFYKGKTVNIIVGFGPGGGYDLYARALGRHIGRHIPGNPSVVVQNMEGGGSVRMANHVFAVAPKDGTVIGAGNQNLSIYQLLGGAGAQYKAQELQWLGSMAYSNGLLYTWHTSGIKTIDDAKKMEVPLGATGTTSDSHIFPTIINEMLDTKFKPINGYTGTGQINIALERGEVAGRGGNTWASVQSANKAWVDEKKINFLVQIGSKPEPELKDVPMLTDLVKSEEDRQIISVAAVPTTIGYAHWVAPGVPADRVKALRDAYAATMKDKEFIAEADKLNMLIRPQTGEEIQEIVKNVTEMPKPVLDRTSKLLGWAK